MDSTAVLTIGEDALTLVGLLQRAASYKGLKLAEGASEAYSEPIKEYNLEGLLKMLAEHGIKRQPRPDCHDIFTLVDEGPQRKAPGWAPSNYWNFGRRDDGAFDLRVSLCVGFARNMERRGFVLLPRAHGTGAGAYDTLPNFRMFKALADSDKDATEIAKEMAASDGSLVVTWTDLGLGGIRTMTNLFAEFAGSNDAINQLGRDGRVFGPNPYQQYPRPGDELFVVEPAQPKVFEAWRAQLERHRNSLAL